MIAKEAPDVALLQEVFESPSEIGLFPTLTEFVHSIKFHHQYFSPVYDFGFMDTRTEFGNAIISNLTLNDKATIFTNREYVHNRAIDDDYNVRNFQHVVIEDQNNKKIHLINHHGYHVPEHKRGNEFTLKACRQIVDYATQLDGPVIIAGDFNLEPSSESIAVLNDHFRNLTTEYGLVTTRNDLTHKVEACDYIFVSHDITVNDFYASTIVASDHQGLVLDFEV